ncbi:DUF302 domain-containing protein [Sphingomonas sp. TREG-RG-20F-R18-01]|uniref:DUF302 domain-containing protein n=1 Tax=Sphingomonas sp. TREG-RG-20F-R18-01 TaxID=2914982 RepID=UPI001F5AF319|nr:DUF302 domain-containing protein [Sphingomonas sp. TREG-RG-20F-R18-01]
MIKLVTLLALMTAPATAQVSPPGDWQVSSTPRTVTDVVLQLRTRINASGGRIVAVVDHAANARSTGQVVPDTTVVIFGNPNLGTPLIKGNRAIALDLPQRMLVWRDGDVTKVGYLRPAVLAARYGFAPDDPDVVAIDKALLGLATAATQP